VDHRVEPPSWLPQGAAPQAADPEADEAPASDDAHAPQDDSAPADSSAEEFSNGNGHESSYTYSRDDSYSSYAEEGPYSSRGPFEEPSKPPFHDLPGAGFAQPPAPPPPGDDLTGSGFVSSGVSVGLPDSDYSGSKPDADSADTAYGPADGGYSPADGGYSPADGGYSDSGFSGSSYRGSGTSAGLPDSGFSSSAAGAGRTDSGLAGGDSYAAPYVPEFPPAPAQAAGPETGGSGAPRMGTTTYAYPPQPPPPPAPAPAAPAKAKRGKQPANQARRANLIVARLEPWSVMKFSFLISLVAWIVLFVAVALLYYALSSLGVFVSLQKTLASVTSSQGSAGVDLSKWTSGTRILGYTMLIGAIDVVLITAMSTLGAVVYNLVTHLGGGIEITLKETE
jgi:hypothetical protein